MRQIYSLQMLRAPPLPGVSWIFFLLHCGPVVLPRRQPAACTSYSSTSTKSRSCHAAAYCLRSRLQLYAVVQPVALCLDAPQRDVGLQMLVVQRVYVYRGFRQTVCDLFGRTEQKIEVSHCLKGGSRGCPLPDLCRSKSQHWVRHVQNAQNAK